jgi:hypothetical protein
MIVKCCVCQKTIKEKEPHNDKRISHSLCDRCLEIEIERIRKWRITYGITYGARK